MSKLISSFQIHNEHLRLFAFEKQIALSRRHFNSWLYPENYIKRNIKIVQKEHVTQVTKNSQQL